ncbi:fluoride efflux transporter CrcB [Rhodococcus sp. NPDC060086]|uniref:fluoride efflux transporter CrcB n=1 Tax=unclassified Rhodococcus (in: high G+C Gram-positive bacteria) TaxID=192944 RepID=UPI003659F143
MTLWVALAGSLGALTRFVVDGEIRSRRSLQFPWATMVVNVSGSLLLGVLVGLVLWHDADQRLEVVLGVGFCGGYTTFSTVSVEAVRLIHEGRYRAALFGALGTLVLAVAAAAAGWGVVGLAS